MISILDLTDSDAVRATLGVDEQELADEVMTAAGVEDELTLDFSEWLPEDVSIEDIISDGESADPGSPDNIKYLRLSSYAKAFCALFFVSNQDNWRLIRLTDGNVDERRRTDTDLEALAEHLRGLLAKHKGAFLDIVDPTNTASSFSMFGISSATYNPVTG